MITTHKINIDLQRIHPAYVVPVMQDDKYSRNIEFTVKENGTEWPIPADSTAIIRFKKPDGTGGNYDALPNDGDAAYTISGNTVTVALAPQVCTVPGIVKLSVCLINGDAELNTFAINLHVQKNPGLSVHSENYYKIAGSVADSGWEPDMYLGTDEEGRVVAKELEATGVSSAEKKLILSLFKAAAYKTNTDVSAKFAELEALWSVSYKVAYSLTGVTASNNAVAVVEGGAYSSTLTAEGGYSLTGAEVTITMGGVDITSTAYSNGVINIAEVTGDVVISVVAKEIPSYTITNNLTGVTTDNSATKVNEGDFYSANLTIDDGLILNRLTITMGGVDITADVYAEGHILIAEVTGNVVITAMAAEPEYLDIVLSGGGYNYYSDTGSASLGSSQTYGYYSPKATAADVTVTVVLTNITAEDVSLSNFRVGNLPSDSSKLFNSSANANTHYAKAIYNGTIAAGESVKRTYTIKAGYHFASQWNASIEVKVIGVLVEKEIPNPYNFAFADGTTGTWKIYADQTKESTRATLNNHTPHLSASAFEEDTAFLVHINRTSDSITPGSNLYFGYCNGGDSMEAFVIWCPSYTWGLPSGNEIALSITVPAGYYLITDFDPDDLTFEKV